MLFNCSKFGHSLRLLYQQQLVQVSHHTIFRSDESKHQFVTTLLRKLDVSLITLKLFINRIMFIHNNVSLIQISHIIEAIN